MNKSDFARELAIRTNIHKSEAMRITNVMLDIFSERLNRKEKMQFSGFGAFETRLTPKRMVRNPRTKEEVIIPARYKAVFKPSVKLLGKLNADKAE